MRALVLLFLVLAGCSIVGHRPAPIVTAPPSESVWLSKTAAAIDQAMADLRTLAPSPARDAALLHLGNARAPLPAPAPADTQQAAEVSALMFAGKHEQAEAAAGKILAEIRAALAKAETERAAAVQALEEEREKHRRELDELRNGLARQVQFWFALGCRILAGICLLIAGVRIYGAIEAGGLALWPALKGSALLLVAACSFVSLSWLTAQPWFFKACAAVVVVTIAALVWIARREQRAEQAKRLIEETASHLVEQIDAAKPTAGEVVALDLAKVGRAMDARHKRAVKAIRDGAPVMSG